MTMATLVPRQFKVMLLDYRDSWSTSVGLELKRTRRRVAAWLYLTPTLAAAGFLHWHVQLPTTAPLLTAMSVFTALLFGLLFLVFNLAVTLRKDGAAIANAHGLQVVAGDLRATVTYTIAVAVALVFALVATTLTMVHADPTDAKSQLVVHWGWTPVLVWLGVHLLLNLMKILERFRTAFNYISR
jgi:hypothetical protein